MRPRVALVALVWTVLAGAFLALAPLGETTSATSIAGDGTLATPPTTQVVETTRESLVDHEGVSVLVVLAMPVALALGGWLAARRGWRPAVVASAVVLGVGAVLAVLSVGVFYVPAAIAMAVAAARR